jgi:hypothetical protein
MKINEPATLPRAFEAALNAGDVEAALALFAPGSTLCTTAGDLLRDTGHQRAYLGHAVVRGARLTHRPLRSVVRRDTVVLVVEWTLTRDGAGPELATGRASHVARWFPASGWRFTLVDLSAGTDPGR